MAEAVQTIGKEEIKKNFIIKHKYGENAWGWPRGKGATIVLSTVKIYYTKRSTTSNRDCKLTIKAVYKNGKHPNHAEGYFLGDLKDEIETLLADEETKVTKMQAKLVQNYSPCNNYRSLPPGGESGCADDILKFKRDMEQQDITFSLTIKFANFYLHDDESNREGLRKLLRNGVELELLQGEYDWKKFLKDKTFVHLTNGSNAEYTELFERATSKERKEREEDDVKIFKEITSKPKGKQKETKQYSHTVKLVLFSH
jgi:hypothetical protein